MTLNEYIMDYGDEKTKKTWCQGCEDQLENIKNDLVKDKAKAYIAQMEDGKQISVSSFFANISCKNSI